MPIKDVETWVCFWAEDVANGGGKTGDSGNFTLRLVSDGTVATPSGSVAEVDATNLPGLYKLLITLGENDGSNMILVGKRSTSDIVIRPVQWTNVVNPTALNGVAQSLLDLKDFADTGYDPAQHKIEDVKNVGTTNTNTDMRGTDSAALASVCTEVRLAELASANLPTDIAAIPTTMRGTDSAALASVCTETRLAELAAGNLPTDIANLGAPLQAAAFTALSGTAGNPRSPTSFEANGLTARAEDWYANQTLLWTNGNLDGLAFFITASSADSTPILTVQAMPEAPADTDTFTILGTKGT